MTQALAVNNIAGDEALDVVQIAVNIVDIDGEDEIQISPPYLEVPENTGVLLVWTLTVPAGRDIRFDTPAISMFGEQPNVAWHPKDPEAPNVRKATWFNDPEFCGRSFFYRVHLLKREGDETIPLSTDPIVHNDPPS